MEPELSNVGRLRLLKTVVREVSKGLAREITGMQKAVDKEDKLGVVMRFLTASEQGNLSAISCCLTRYPEIAELVTNPYAMEGNLSIHRANLNDHAVELARGIALGKLQTSQDDEEADAFEASKTARRGQGSSSSLLRVEVVVEQWLIRMARLLQTHTACLRS